VHLLEAVLSDVAHPTTFVAHRLRVGFPVAQPFGSRLLRRPRTAAAAAAAATTTKQKITKKKRKI